MIKAIFFSRFHLEKGPVIVHQVPEGSIVPVSDTITEAPLLDFASVSDYLIPRQEFCDQLITVCTEKHRVIGHPVCIVNPGKYDRNELIFNFALVVHQDADITSYQGVVRKLATFFKELEHSNSFLSRDGGDMYASSSTMNRSSRATVYALCEMIMEDLNNYCECMIPTDEANILNLKLFPILPAPPPIFAWHVPISTVRLAHLIDDNWDLTMCRIVPFIDGINSVARIAHLADADLRLTRKALSHLLYYGCLILLDIFQFSAIYAPTPEIGDLLTDHSTQSECARYIATPGQELKKDTVVQLYAALSHGKTLRNWCLENTEKLVGVDVRRFITFGVVKGFLYRVHSYALYRTTRTKSASPAPKKIFDGDLNGSTKAAPLDRRLRSFLDGTHSFDEICTRLQISEKELITCLREHRDIQIIHR